MACGDRHVVIVLSYLLLSTWQCSSAKIDQNPQTRQKSIHYRIPHFKTSCNWCIMHSKLNKAEALEGIFVRRTEGETSVRFMQQVHTHRETNAKTQGNSQRRSISGKPSKHFREAKTDMQEMVELARASLRSLSSQWDYTPFQLGCLCVCMCQVLGRKL